MSFLPHSTGTVASEFHDTCFPSARYGIRKFLYTNVVPVSFLHKEIDDVSFILVNFKVVAPPDDVDEAAPPERMYSV